MNHFVILVGSAALFALGAWALYKLGEEEWRTLAAPVIAHLQTQTFGQQFAAAHINGLLSMTLALALWVALREWLRAHFVSILGVVAGASTLGLIVVQVLIARAPLRRVANATGNAIVEGVIVTALCGLAVFLGAIMATFSLLQDEP
ncbi:hypothetical protein HZA86_03180 [Candidatus Uhrbacteria bacterium]|nr:hypothetical protein [Candidatus Uhrbacteria bacterium]